MQTTIYNTLKEHIELLKQFSNEQYITPITELSNATVGQHTRHIIELFQCLQIQYQNGTVNYDSRKRNKIIETNISYAISCINNIVENLNKPDKTLNLLVALNGNTHTIATNYYRELYYNLEHCIHHQALIKVAIIKLGNITIGNEFGVAPSTLQYRLQCAQ